MKRKFYNGTIELNFDEARHRYEANGKSVRGVTSILDVLNKPALLNWGVNKAVDHIHNAFVTNGSIDLDVLDAARYAHTKMAKGAADTGSIVHKAIEKWIKGGQLTEVFEVDDAELAYRSFLKWEADNKVKIESAEEMVYSKEHNYAGTYDFICTIDGKRYMGDIKTSNGIYPSYWMQVAAYQQALQEEDPKQKFDGLIIVRCSKDGKLDVQFNTNYEANRDAFNHCVALDKHLNGKTI